jgi:hypothetical protein
MDQITYRGVKYPIKFDWDTLQVEVIMPNGLSTKFYFYDDTIQIWEVIKTLESAISVELDTKIDTGIEID